MVGKQYISSHGVDSPPQAGKFWGVCASESKTVILSDFRVLSKPISKGFPSILDQKS